MIQESKPEDYQKNIESQKPKQGQENVEKLKSETTTLGHDGNDLRNTTAPMTFLEDLDKDIGRKFPKTNQCQASDKVQPTNVGVELEKDHSDQHCKTRNKGGKISNHSDNVETNEKRNAGKLTSSQANIAEISAQSSSKPKPCLEQVSSKIPKPVRSQRSNVGIQLTGGKVTHSCRTVPVTDRNMTQYKRQRQPSLGRGSNAAVVKHPQSALKDGKRCQSDMESHRSRMKQSQSTPIRKYEALDVILPAKKGAGAESQNKATEILGDMESSENQALESRNEFLVWLSKAIGEKQLNICDLDDAFSNYKSILVSTNNTDSEPQSITKELEIEVLQKLIKKVSDLYEQCQSQKIANTKLKNSYELAHNNDSKKIVLLESENQDLINSMENLSKRLDDEKANNDRMKKGSQTLPTMKKKIRDIEQVLKNMDNRQREQIQKLKSLESNCKLKNLGNIEKELNEITAVYENLIQENGNLKKELQKSVDKHNLKLSEMIDNSQEMKEMREQLSNITSKYNEELNKGKRYLAEQQQTSFKLKEMEARSKELSHLIQEAKSEIKAKNHEFEEFKKGVEMDRLMMKTELDACKVTKQGALDENVLLRSKIELLQNKNERVHSLENDSIEMENQLRTDLAIRDEQISQLQEQIKTLLAERRNYSKDVNKMRNKMSLDQSQINNQERANLAAQILDLQKNVDELANNNLELQKLLADRNTELEQRDQIVKLQTDVLKIRDELIELLRSKDSKHEKHVEELSSILMEREQAIEKEWKSRMSKFQEPHSNQTKLQQLNTPGTIDPSLKDVSDDEKVSLKDLHLMFQNKELDLDSMQVRIKALEKVHQNFNQQRIRQESRMRILEESLQEKSSHTWIPVLVK